jgi:hypothetical protein
VAFSRQGRFFGAATFTSDVRIFEVQYTREGDLKKVAKVMDLKKAHNGQVRILSILLLTQQCPCHCCCCYAFWVL